LLDQDLNYNFIYVDDQNKMSFLLQEIKYVKVIALDTEFIRSDTYFPILSLIQIAFCNKLNQKKIFIIDCLQNVDLEPFLAIIYDPNIIKIFHSAVQDLQIFFHKTKQRPRSIVDTQLMANFCGFSANIGYARLVENIFGKTIDKKLQRSDWVKRPLARKQLEYATLDVFFLNEIYLELNKNLIKNNRQQFYLEEIEKFIDHVISDNKKNLLKNFIFSKRNPRISMFLKNIIFWREEQAKKLNIPRQHFIMDNQLYEIINNKKLPNHILDKIDQQAIDKFNNIFQNELLQDNLSSSIDDNDYALNNQQKIIFLEAKKIISKIARSENISEQFLLNTNDLKKIIIEPEKFLNNSQQILGNWRYCLIFEDLAKLLKINL